MQKTLITLFSVLLFITLMPAICWASPELTTTTTPYPAAKGIEDVQSVFTQAKAEGKSVIIIWNSSWCATCTIFNYSLSTDVGIHHIVKRDYLVINVPSEAPFGEALMYRTHARWTGVPGFTIVDATGKERSNQRIYDYYFPTGVFLWNTMELANVLLSYGP